jgi:hypothetical protein
VRCRIVVKRRGGEAERWGRRRRGRNRIGWLVRDKERQVGQVGGIKDTNTSGSRMCQLSDENLDYSSRVSPTSGVWTSGGWELVEGRLCTIGKKRSWRLAREMSRNCPLLEYNTYSSSNSSTLFPNDELP